MSQLRLPDPPPPGYGALEPLDRSRHAGRSLPSGDYRFARTLQSVYLTAAEFFHALRDYPIPFVPLDPPADGLLPMALLGLRPGRNPMVDGEGRWRAGCYIPAYLRRHPLFTVPVRRAGDGSDRSGEPLICVDPECLIEGGEVLFLADGRDGPGWSAARDRVERFEAASRATQALVTRVRELDLLEPFEAHAAFDRGGGYRIGNLMRVSEERLNRLPAEAIRRLMEEGMLSRIYAHLISLENFRLLLDHEANSERRPQP